MTSPLAPAPELNAADAGRPQPPSPADSSSRRVQRGITSRRLTVASADLSQRLRSKSTWRAAFWTLVVMIRNVSVSTAIAFLANLWFSRGSMFSALPPQQQRHDVFLTGVVLATFSLNCLLNLLLQAARLFPNRFARWPERRPSIFYCVFRMVQGSYVHLLVSLLCLVGIGLFCGNLAVRWRKFKPEYYIAAAFTQYFYAVLDMVARKVYQEETVSGQQKALERQQRCGGLPIRRPSLVRRVVRVFMQNFPILLSIWFSGAYVHLVSQSEISQGMQMMAFLVVSMVVKLVVQEVAKHYVMKRNVTHIKNMCIVVGIPTVLINTQVRIVILSMRDAQSTMNGTYAMAVLEVVLRFGKVALLRWQIKSRKRATTRQNAGPTVVAVVPTVASLTAKQTSQKETFHRFREWRAQMFSLHTAEIYADMYAEYIAMGCSSGIYYFFADHTQYQLGVHSSASSPNATSASSSSSSSSPSSSSLLSSVTSVNQLTLVLAQVAIEIIVDFVSCVVEILNGIDFDHLDGFGVFLGSLFTLTALLNTSISAVLYIAPTTAST